MKMHASDQPAACCGQSERIEIVTLPLEGPPKLASGTFNKILFALTAVLLIFAGTARAEEKAPIGKGLTLKIDYIDFTDGFIADNDIDKSVYLGVEGYAKVAEQIFFGLEVGIANPSGTVNGQKTELTYVPIELNAKYVSDFLPGVGLSVGGGMSANHASEKVVSNGSVFDNSGWVLGGQIFGEALYSQGNFFAGFNAKYQFTDNLVENGVPAHRFSNWRLGGLAGLYF